MKPRRLLFALVVLVAASPVLGQPDFPMPGVNVSRDSNIQTDSLFRPPFRYSRGIQLPNGGSSVYSIGQHLLIRRNRGYDFCLLSGPQSQPQLVWSKSTLPPGAPAFSRGVVLLQSAATTSVQAVSISDGQTLWNGPGVGNVVYSSLATGNVAFFHGPQRLIAARLDTGAILWEYEPAAGLANAPLSLSGDLLFALDKAGLLHAFSISTGEEIWSADVGGGDGGWIIATPETVFVSSGYVYAIKTSNGSTRWKHEPPTYQIPQIAWAHGLLYVTYPGGGWTIGPTAPSHVVALRGESGVKLWDFSEEAYYPPPINVGPGSPLYTVIRDFFVTDGIVYFYNFSTNSIRALDAMSGSLVWSERVEAKSITVFDHQLALLSDDLRMYSPSRALYLPQFAFGQGYSIRLTVNNPHDEPVTAYASFFDSSGARVPVKDSEGKSDPVPISLPPLSSATIVIPDTGEDLKSGWAMIDAAAAVTGNLVYQFRSGTTGPKEVAVADSRPTDFAQVKVSHGDGFSTAVAFVVLSNRGAVITAQLLDSQGHELAENGFTMEARSQTARFFNHLFYPPLNVESFDGTLIIRSDQPIAVTAIRTENGTPISALPVGLAKNRQ